MERLTVAEDIVAGGVAGSLGTIFGVPFDMVKVRMQSFPLKYTSAWQTFKLTVKEEGFLGVYRGSSVPITSQVFINALAFSGDGFASKMLEPELKKGESMSTLNSYLSGCFGGLCQCIVLAPTDLIKCRLQVDDAAGFAKRKYNGVMDCVVKTVKMDGISGLFRGMGVCAIREVPSLGFYFATYKTCKHQLQQYIDPHSSALIAGGIAGSASWFCIFPIDIIKTNIQVAPLGSVDAELGTIAMGKKLLKERGFRFFYRGLGVTLMRAFPVNAITFWFYEMFGNAMLERKRSF